MERPPGRRSAEVPVVERAVGPDEPVTDVLLSILVDESDVPLAERPPVYDVVDPDALDQLFARRDTSARVTFQYANHSIQITGSRIRVYDVP